MLDAGAGVATDDPTDICFPIRRALLMRVALGARGSDRLDIDRGLLSALLELSEYRHGARSLDRMVSLMGDGKGGRIRRSDLPPSGTMDLHLNREEFVSIMSRDAGYQANADDLAPAVHAVWLPAAKRGKQKSDYAKAFAALPDDIRDDNRAAAARVPQVLELAGLYLTADDKASAPALEEIKGIIERDIELLAEAEHDGWAEHKRHSGWRFGRETDDRRRVHSALRPYPELDEAAKEKDRSAVRSYPELAALAGYRIVTDLE